MEKVKKDDICVECNFTFGVRCSKLLTVPEERDFRGMVSGFVKMLVQESTAVNRKKMGCLRAIAKNYRTKLKNAVALHAHESWVLLGNLSPCHCKDTTEEVQRRAVMMKKFTEQLPEEGLDRQELLSSEKRHCRELLTEL